MNKVNWKAIDYLAIVFAIIIMIIMLGILLWMTAKQFINAPFLDAVRLGILCSVMGGFYYLFSKECKRRQKLTSKNLKCSENSRGAFYLYTTVMFIITVIADEYF